MRFAQMTKPSDSCGVLGDEAREIWHAREKFEESVPKASGGLTTTVLEDALDEGAICR